MNLQTVQHLLGLDATGEAGRAHHAFENRNSVSGTLDFRRKHALCYVLTRLCDYWINQDDNLGDKNYWFFGWLLQRKVTEKLTLGGEIFHQTADTVAGVDSTGFNLGGQYDFRRTQSFPVFGRPRLSERF